jgi:hypothetical protein
MSYSILTGDSKYTYAEYIAMEEVTTDRHNFYRGEIFAIAGGTKNHNNIILNMGVSLKAIKKSGCGVFIDGMTLEIEKDQFYVYPDLIYTCNDDLKGND